MPTALAAAVALSLLAPIAFVVHAWTLGGALSFPLDDAWIHLQYARTLREHGVFAYFPGAARSAGSTAPLFTLLETSASVHIEREATRHRLG